MTDDAKDAEAKAPAVEDAVARAREALAADSKRRYEKGVEAVTSAMKEHGIGIAAAVAAEVGEDGTTRHFPRWHFYLTT